MGKPISHAPGKIDAGLELPFICDVCHRPKRRGTHAVCSRIRQRKHAKESKNVEPQ